MMMMIVMMRMIIMMRRGRWRGTNDEDDPNVEFIGFSWDQETNIIKKLGGRSDEVNLI